VLGGSREVKRLIRVQLSEDCREYAGPCGWVHARG
jgi:hypothetical protein